MRGVVIIGKAGSGKDTAAGYLVRQHGYVQYAFADRIRDIVAELFPDEVLKGKPRHLLQGIGSYMRQLDPDVWVRYLFSRIEREKPGKYVISDCRYPNELKFALEHGAVPLYIHCPDAVRLERLQRRDGTVNGDLLGHESECAVEAVLDQFFGRFITIDNSSTLAELYRQIDAALSLSSPSSSATRPEWHETFISIAREMARRSTCLRKQVGAVLVKDKHIIATGYNGVPKGLAHCTSLGCVRAENNVPSGHRYELCRSVHAEENCIIQAATFGVSTVASELYCTHCPCILCAKTIINAGVKQVYYQEGEPEPLTIQLFRDAGVVIQRLTD